ncbi:hypothetical protein [Gimesia maris]|uniref:hypothetical protein n=1 Tax=Gimesia maris TaxID=122 RepID=UPI003A915954
MPQPKLDEDLVQRLAKIAARLDGGDEVADASLLDEFNQLAGTDIPFSEFQGIYGAEEHIDYVRRVLTDRATEASPDLSREGLIEMFAKVLAAPCDDAYVQYVFNTINQTFGDTQISDLIFWPGEYFGDGNNQRELTPELIADAVLERYAKRQPR